MSILHTLKTGTREHHVRAERSIPILKKSEVTLDRYRNYLARLLGFYEPVESALAAQDWAAAGLDFDARRKVPLLVADLMALGLDASAQSALPRCATIPCVDALPEALGCAYVLEGATRGGQVLGPLVEGALGATRPRGSAFLLAYGDENDGMWSAFGRAIEGAITNDDQADRALAAAQSTFTLLQRWIDEGPGEGSTRAPSG